MLKLLVINPSFLHLPYWLSVKKKHANMLAAAAAACCPEGRYETTLSVGAGV